MSYTIFCYASQAFNVLNDVRKGHDFSPYLFNMDELSAEFSTLNIACNVNGTFINHLFYGDDSVCIGLIC